MARKFGGKGKGVKGGKAKVETDASQAGKGTGKATKAIGKTTSSAPDGGTPDGNPTAQATKGSPHKGKGK
jgi:hypothetical protein